MKKWILKWTIMGVVVVSYCCIAPVKKALIYPLNNIFLTQMVASNLYEHTEPVSASPMIVKDYILEENRLYIFPLDDKVILPVDVMVSDIRHDTIEVITNQQRYLIYHFNHPIARMYEYVHAKNEIGRTTDFYVIEGDDVQCLAERLTIYYEKI